MFSGSYLPEDVTFLLKVIDIPPIEIAEKERLIQSGQRHYSEMIHRESPPSARYLSLFQSALKRNAPRFAADLAAFAAEIAATVSGEITLVSLARAGTPVGVLLRRILKEYLGRDAAHYSVSIIRDRGIDEVAMRHILEVDGREPEGIVFVDGWTGKGVIARELKAAIDDFNARWESSLPNELHVVADISGSAAVSATSDDYLIPSSILNAVVSGLISRSILNAEYIGPTDFHGCVYYEEFAAQDLSRSFVDDIMTEVASLPDRTWTERPRLMTPEEKAALRKRSDDFIASAEQTFGIRSVHHVKPGIGEATRVLLRRVPDRVLLRNLESEDVAHLVQLASEKNVPIVHEPNLPYNAVAIIRELD